MYAATGGDAGGDGAAGGRVDRHAVDVLGDVGVRAARADRDAMGEVPTEIEALIVFVAGFITSTPGEAEFASYSRMPSG